jgi:hypothetical protein
VGTYAAAPLCYYCGQRVILRKLAKHETTPDNYATLDHLHDRYSFPNGRPKEDFTLVLACSKCNWERARRAEREVPIEELRQRSGRHGRRKVTP